MYSISCFTQKYAAAAAAAVNRLTTQSVIQNYKYRDVHTYVCNIKRKEKFREKCF